jgi:hypothetical protein
MILYLTLNTHSTAQSVTVSTGRGSWSPGYCDLGLEYRPRRGCLQWADNSSKEFSRISRVIHNFTSNFELK